MKDIINQFNERNERAFELIFKVAYPKMILWAIKILGDYDDAQDIVIVSFRKLWESKSRFEAYEQIEAFMYKSVKNECLNYIKSLQHRFRKTKELMDDYAIEDEVNNSLIDKLYECINSLPFHYRQLILFDLQGFSNKEVSKMINVKTTTIETKKWRALQMLKSLLNK